MSNFPGGSAFAMARDIAEGYQTVTDRTFRNMPRAGLEQLSFEIDRQLRDTRSVQIDLSDLVAIKAKNRKIQRLNTAMMVIRAYKQKTRR
jgi:hypothetical protein